MAGQLQFANDIGWKPEGFYGGFLAAEREQELGLHRLLQQLETLQNIEGQQYQNQITESSVPAKQSEFTLSKLMSDQAINTPGYAQTVTQGTMDEARNKGELYKKSKTANEETSKDIAEADALRSLDNAIQGFTIDPETPAAGPMALDALEKLGIPIQDGLALIDAGTKEGKTTAEILRTVRDQYVEFKARSPKFMEKSLIQTQRDSAEMARVKEKMTGAAEVARIRAAVQNAVAKSKGDKLNLDQLIARDLQTLYPDPIERLYATQMAQQFKGEVTKYSNSGMVINRDEQGNSVIGQPTAPTPNLGRQGRPSLGVTPIEDRSGAVTTVPGASRQEVTGTIGQPPKDQVQVLPVEEAKKRLGNKFNPELDYGVNAQGQLVSTPKRN